MTKVTSHNDASHIIMSRRLKKPSTWLFINGFGGSNPVSATNFFTLFHSIFVVNQLMYKCTLH